MFRVPGYRSHCACGCLDESLRCLIRPSEPRALRSVASDGVSVPTSAHLLVADSLGLKSQPFAERKSELMLEGLNSAMLAEVRNRWIHFC